MAAAPRLVSVVLDTTDARTLAEFYRALLQFTYRAGDEPPPPGEPDPRGQDWLVLEAPGRVMRLAVQQVGAAPAPTWPSSEVPQQLHLDLSVPTAELLAEQRDRVVELGGRILHDRSHDQDEPLYVFADPAGHPFCIFVAPDD